MLLPEHPLRPTAVMALLSIFAVVLLVVVSSNNQNTGMASGYNIPKNECTTLCQAEHGPGWIGIPQGKYGNWFNHCICQDSSYVYRKDYFYKE